MPSEQSAAPRLIVVAGAKGGVGTSLIAANAAVHLATSGRRVVAVDADASGGDLHVLLGAARLPAPRMRIRIRRWEDFETETVPPAPTAASIDPSAGATPQKGVIPSLLVMRAGVDAPPKGRTRRTSLREAMLRAKKLDCDDVVLDLGNAANEQTALAWTLADRWLFVTTPDASALEGMYRFVRWVSSQAARKTVKQHELRSTLDNVLRDTGGAPAPNDLVELVQRESPELARQLQRCLKGFQFPFVINQTSMRADNELGGQIEIALHRRYGVDVQYRGFVESDTAVSFATRRRRPLLLESPGAKSSRAIEKLTRRYLARDASIPPGRRNESPAGSYHELLGVDRTSSDEEIRRAYKRMCTVFDERSMATFGLFHPDDLVLLRKYLNEASEILLDPPRRGAYERGVFPNLQPSGKRATTPEARAPLPPPPEVDSETLFTGALLRAVRESQGVDLHDISHRTKVGAAHLSFIETEDYDQLPAAVYVRGFVAEVAKFLKLDPMQVSQSYVERYESYLEARGQGT